VQASATVVYLAWGYDSASHPKVGLMTDTQRSKAVALAGLHVPGNPLVLYNAWDVGSAKAIAEAGAKAIATGSWSVAAANGFEDREKLPLDRVVDVIGRIVSAVSVPVTLDFESGYARGGPALEANVRRVIDAGAVGINFEDQVIGGSGMYSIDEQSERIRAVRRAADASGVPLFINARTDGFIQNDVAKHGAVIDDAIARAKAYAAAGASGLFVPAIRDEALIRRMCAESPLPVNVLYYPELPSREKLAQAGVARISYGPRPYREAMARLTEAAKAALMGR
jgi:2-methylisocitrate lyase-like PEP mutase family enzyme